MSPLTLDPRLAGVEAHSDSPPQQRSDPTPFVVVSNMFNPEE